MADPLDRVTVEVGGGLADLFAARPLAPFSAAVVAFVEALGRSLRADPATRGFPELVALGFWARGATIARLRRRFEEAYPESARLPRGLAFHIAPSNVDTIFVYSLLLSMLAGNVNLVRVSSRGGDQAGALMAAFGRALEGADPAVRRATGIVRYEHDKGVTDALSAACDLRIVWGGDDTVRLVRESALAAHGVELVFPNKYSLAVMDAAAWLALEDVAPAARAFVNDALWFGQMACSSPRTLVWRGTAEAAHAASARFWPAVEDAAETAGFAWEDAHAVAKLLAEQGAAMDEGAEILPTRTNRVRVIRCAPARLGDPTGVGNGFFRETRIDALADLAAVARRDWQTVVSFGIPTAEWRAALAALPAGIDRVVRIGTALDFDAIWDGKDLLAGMTRIVALSV